MEYFIRYTATPKADLKRKASYHSTPFRVGDITKKDVAKLCGCETKDIVVLNRYYAQKLHGLCGFSIDEEELSKDFPEHDIYGAKWAVYSGIYRDQCPEGVVFYPIKLIRFN